MRFSFTLILLLSFVSLVKGQSNISEPQHEDEDRKRLENQFKALKNFYINDQGLVVYQTRSDDARVITNDDEKAINNPSDTVVVYVDEFSRPDSVSPVYNTGASGKASSEPEITNSQEYNSPLQEYNSPSGSNRAVNVVSINKRPVDPVFFNNAERKETDSGGTRSESEEPKEESKTNTVSPVSKPVIATNSSTPTPASSATTVKKTNQAYAEKTVSESKKTGETVVTGEKKATSYPAKKKSVFDKAPSKYGSLEEAAEAAQALLDELKAEQPGGASKPGSLSSRISRGAGTSLLRKEQSSTNNTFGTGLQNRPVISEKTVEAEKKYEEATTPYTVEPTPTYYINGIEVDKSIVDRLKKNDILSREVRSRNTQSGNPAGEVWIQLK